MELSIMFLKAAEHVTDMEFRTSTEKILLNLDGTEKKWIPTNRWYCRKNDQDRSCSVLNDTGYAPSHWYPLHPYAGDGNRISLVDLNRGQCTRQLSSIIEYLWQPKGGANSFIVSPRSHAPRGNAAQARRAANHGQSLRDRNQPIAKAYPYFPVSLGFTWRSVPRTHSHVARGNEGKRWSCLPPL